MEYILTERQFGLISKRVINEQKNYKTIALDSIIDRIFGKNIDDAEKLIIRKETDLVIPSNLKRSLNDLDQAITTGTKTATEFEDELGKLMKTPEIKDFILSVVERKLPKTFDKFATEVIEDYVNRSGLNGGVERLEKIIELSKDLNSAQVNVKKFMGQIGLEGPMNEKIIESYVNKKFGKGQTTNPEVKSRFDLTRTNFKTRPIRDFGKVKISDNLEMITKPRWKDYVAQVQNIKNPDQHMDLKIGKDDFGEFYFLSAKMENPIDAGRSFQELMKKIPKGARFGESASGSLSTDSFYNMLRRVKSFEPKVVGRIRLNKSGIKRFQEYIKNPVESNEYPPILRFKNFNDAKPLIDVLNSEIKKVGLNTSATISKNSDGLFEILIPNIQLIMK